jgi:electron transport complex protein RnfG
MSEAKTIPIQESVSSFKMLQAMVGIGILCALLIVVTYEGTLPRIERLKAEALEKAIFKVIPGTRKTKTFEVIQDGFIPLNGDAKGKQVVYAGYDSNNELVGVAIEASGQGYADIIRILYGYNPNDQTIVGFYVLESKETPGLGDKIEKEAHFLANFEAMDVSLTDDGSAVKNTVATVKQGAKQNSWEVDGITGATISSRAIGSTLAASTQHWMPLIYKNLDAFTLKNE